MFAEKVCEQVVGFSVMAEDEMFDVNGGKGWFTDVITGVGQAIAGSSSNGVGNNNTVKIGSDNGSSGSSATTSGEKSPAVVGDNTKIYYGDVYYQCSCGCCS